MAARSISMVVSEARLRREPGAVWLSGADELSGAEVPLDPRPVGPDGASPEVPESEERGPDRLGPACAFVRDVAPGVSLAEEPDEPADPEVSA